MKAAIILNEPYPHGMACANRTHLYTRGLAELGNDVVVVIPRPTEFPGSIRNPEGSGIYDGVRFRYANGPVISKSFAGRRIQNLLSPGLTLGVLLRFRPDVILVVSNSLRHILTGKLAALLAGAKLVREKTEVPYYRLKELSRLKKIRIRLEFKLFDGLLVISPALRAFFKSEMNLKNLKIAEVPILIGKNPALPDKITPPDFKNLVYTGSLIDSKDGILTIIRAFSKIPVIGKWSR